MIDDVKRLIEQLREPVWGESVRVVNDRLRTAALFLESLAAELEQVKRERDAAVEKWKQSAIAGKSMCDTCMFSDDEGRCWNDCIDGELWQWRGVKE